MSMTGLSARARGAVWLLFVAGCSPEVWVANGESGASGASRGGASSAEGGSNSSASGGAAAGQGGAATASGGAKTNAGGSAMTSGGSAGASGNGGAAGLGGGTPGSGGSAGAMASCTPGADQTCNDPLSVSAIWGTCLPNGTCRCDPGRVINPSTGKCMLAGPCVGGSCDCRLTNQVELESEAARRDDLLVHRSKTGFVLDGAGTNSAGPPVFIQASWQGELAASQFDGAISNTDLDLLLNVAPIADEAGLERLLVLGRGPGEGTLHGIWSTLWEAGAAEPSAENRLFLAMYAGQVVTYAIGRSDDGKRVVFSYGHRVVDAGPTVAVLGPSGAPVTPPTAVTFSAKLFDSLQVVPTPTSAAVSALAMREDTQEIFWDVVELDAGGALTFQASARIDDFEDLAIAHKPKMIQTADGYLGWFPSNSGHERFLRIPRARAAGDPAELWQTAEGFQTGLVDLAAVGNDLALLRSDAGKLVVQRVQATGEPFAVPLVLSDISPTFDSLRGPARLFAVENTTVYVTFMTNGSRVIAALECPPRL
jgi:hypothetical protein